MPTTVGIVGHGAFGALLETLIRRFAPSVVVRIYSSRQKSDSIRFFSLADTALCDVVILAVPIHAFEETLLKILPLIRKETVIVDVATVKEYTTKLLKQHAVNQSYIAMHPMFGPESYEKQETDISGFRIVITDHTLPHDVYIAVVSFLKQCGFTVVEMTSNQHDKHLAETLFLTHLVGQVVARGKFDRTQIDTVSFGYLMNAVESVRNDTALFRDVYHFNPHCKDVLTRFQLAETEVHSLLEEK